MIRFLKQKIERTKESKAALAESRLLVERNCIEDEQLAKRTKYAEYVVNCPIKQKNILYESYCGRGLICGPYAIFKQLLSSKEYEKFVHIWVLEDFEENREIIREYEGYDNVKFIEFESDEYLEYLATAQYLVNNVSFRGYFTKRKEQIFIDTWHGIPLKKIGFDITDGNISAGNTDRNLLMADYLISPNTFMTDIYKKAFKLEGIYKGKILQVGQARSDCYFNVKKEDIVRKLQALGVAIDPKKKLVLYAPTWKGERYRTPDTSLETYFELIQRIEKKLGTEEYQVLVKPHQVVYKFIKNQPKVTQQFVPAMVDTNELLSVVDILISDYSSIYFDFLVSRKPILFFVPDLEEYTQTRGLYFGVDKLPGPIAQNYEELEAMLDNIDRAMEPHWKKYYEEQQWACGNDDGKVCSRIVDAVFRKKAVEQSIICETSGKKRILIYGGPLITNGITSSFLTLLQNMDYEKYDVTVLTHGAHNPDAAERIRKMPKEVRVLYRSLPYAATREENAKHLLIMERGLKQGILAPASFYEREMYRLVGPSEFDYAIEFTGYSRLYSVLIAHMKHVKKMIWVHNDLQRELDRENNGGLNVGKSLLVCFSTYPYMDKIVGCSKSVMEINRANFATRKTQRKFAYVRNLVNDKRVLEEKTESRQLVIDGREYYIIEQQSENSTSIKIRTVEFPKEEMINFVTMGRLSPEKNHENLIRAFAALYKENPKVRLYILGEGPLRNRLESLIIQEKLEHAVNLTGILTEPFQFMKRCQCFILPSNYEGQPLVIQEARILQLPIIVAEFASVEDVLIPNGQLLTGQSVESIYEGMRAFLDGRVPEYSFSAAEYNKKVYKEFEQLFEMR